MLQIVFLRLCRTFYALPFLLLFKLFSCLKKYLKDDFNTGGVLGNWFLTEPTKMDTKCGIVFDGNSLSFSGIGPRQVETTDLDLRDAT